VAFNAQWFRVALDPGTGKIEILRGFQPPRSPDTAINGAPDSRAAAES
jgi:hypothetical protein